MLNVKAMLKKKTMRNISSPVSPSPVDLFSGEPTAPMNYFPEGTRPLGIIFGGMEFLMNYFPRRQLFDALLSANTHPRVISFQNITLSLIINSWEVQCASASPTLSASDLRSSRFPMLTQAAHLGSQIKKKIGYRAAIAFGTNTERTTALRN